jgi:hypothetical protein
VCKQVLQSAECNIAFAKLQPFLKRCSMKSFIFGVALCAAAFPALAQTNVSISVGQPGFYGLRAAPDAVCAAAGDHRAAPAL